MKKATAIALLGGSVRSAAKALRCSRQAVAKWPHDGPLSPRIADRVIAACVRQRAEEARARGEELNELEEDALSM